MNLLRKTWAIIIVVIMASCHTERLDMVSPNGNLKVTIKPAEEHASNGTSSSVTYIRRKRSHCVNEASERVYSTKMVPTTEVLISKKISL